MSEPALAQAIDARIDAATAARDAGVPPRAATPSRSFGRRASLLRRIDWEYAAWIIGYHLLALLALLPWFFSWTGVILCALGIYVFGVLGINLCYHRLLAHRGFTCPKWLEHTLVVLAICCVQDTPTRWVAVHRRHHQHADEAADPHSPSDSARSRIGNFPGAGFLWAHVGWLLVRNTELARLRIYDRYAKDINHDRFYRSLERPFRNLGIILASWLAFYLGGFAAALARGGSLDEAVQFGLSLFIWGVVVRTVIVWHQTWAVNSLAHMWGYRRYATDVGSRNNAFVGIVSNGEVWLNHHHADSRSARHGHRWWELDATWLAIRLLGAVGLAHDIIRPDPRRLAPLDGRLTTRGEPA
jgi:stearoyl-CoA desaturase (delta-9 desaturase)